MALWQCIWCQALIVGDDAGVTAAGWARSRHVDESGSNDALCPTCQHERSGEVRVALDSGRAEILDGILYLHDP
jgi:hypothetical protein